jgi:hypothetical protein
MSEHAASAVDQFEQHRALTQPRRAASSRYSSKWRVRTARSWRFSAHLNPSLRAGCALSRYRGDTRRVGLRST